MEKEEFLLGIEDAGRGPVIGPLIMAGVKIIPNVEEKFKEVGVKDSKLLTPTQRYELAETIRNNSEFKVIRVWPYEIDFGIESGVNLNTLEAIKAAQIINDLKPTKVVIDCPSPNIPAWKEEVSKRVMDREIRIICEHKADVNHPVVSAASIIAKVTRDEEVAKIQRNIPQNIGSGYPSDPITKKFIEENWEDYRDIFRHSWETIRRQKDNKSQKNVFEY